ncbi:hypothetical protein SODALDRAFT_129502 [Sodiomyces alkalinus F11]|uniref:Uncharacterized protein n=1 Tax=Sodiomyces alkalinus (strain CBS 110278 / VKM F-3762 / F11) TaxID=1314773 RepID=A0A3N2Q4S5_SODAK|nr:hypothetical protein SODALDRAFT_129502 [Sodiomyces alkalinus F11]ROT41774.1 hypothetical protein SODALDRAFT_129502 [Sodiomyces alkalinus F11]
MLRSRVYIYVLFFFFFFFLTSTCMYSARSTSRPYHGSDRWSLFLFPFFLFSFTCYDSNLSLFSSNSAELGINGGFFLQHGRCCSLEQNVAGAAGVHSDRKKRHDRFLPPFHFIGLFFFFSSSIFSFHRGGHIPLFLMANFGRGSQTALVAPFEWPAS